MSSFSEGYQFFENLAGASAGAFQGGRYVDKVKAEIDSLVKDLNSFEGYKSSTDTLKGDVAEFWHADTFNIDAALKGSAHRANVDRSHDFASVDLSTNFGDSYGSKYYKSGVESAKAHSVNYEQAYREYQANGGKQTFQDFLADRGREGVDPFASIYEGQFRLIPKDQLQNATKWLEEKIAKESSVRPEEVARYKDTLEMLKTKIEDGKGVESIELSKEQAAKLAEMAKNGEIDAKTLGFTTEKMIKFDYVMHQALKAGLSAATISIVLKVAPELFKAIDVLIKTGKLNAEEFRKLGFSALSGGAEGFIRGTVSATITTACKAGLLGEALTAVDPSVVGAVTVVTINTMKNAFSVVQGKMTGRELASDLTKDMFVSTCSLMGGAISQAFIEVPVLGYMLGSFVGSMIGAFAYHTGYKAIISFCINSGYTMFGLVDQNFVLPMETMKEIGLNVFEYDKFTYEEFNFDHFEKDTFEYDQMKPDSIGISFLRRGVIGVSEIGYV